GLPIQVEATSYDFNLKYNSRPLTAAPMMVRFFGLGGLAVAPLKVLEGSWTFIDEDILAPGDASFTGFGANLGGGLEFGVLERISLMAGIKYRYLRYGVVSGPDGEKITIEDGIKGGSWSTSIDLVLYLQ
ncbi:MAG: hypothetical protein ABIJ61_11710, partial [bacterium]